MTAAPVAVEQSRITFEILTPLEIQTSERRAPSLVCKFSAFLSPWLDLPSMVTKAQISEHRRQGGLGSPDRLCTTNSFHFPLRFFWCPMPSSINESTWRRVLWLAGFCLVNSAQAQVLHTEGAKSITSMQTPTIQPITAGKSQMVAVREEVRLIEEEGLPMDPSLQSTTRPAENTTTGGRTAAAMTEDINAKDNGLKLYRFTLAPGETLITNILCDPTDEVTQRFGLLSGPSFTPTSASTIQLARINRLSRQQRTSRIEFRNMERRPFPLLLVVYGSAGYPYKVQITRDVAK